MSIELLNRLKNQIYFNMGKLSELQRIKKEISDNDRANKALTKLYSELENADQLNASGLMKVYINGGCEVRRPREIESIFFTKDYCATQEELVLFAEAVAVMVGQENHPIIHINRV